MAGSRRLRGGARSALGRAMSEDHKPAWPKSSRRYRTITGRRYGRWYAYIGFTPSSSRQARDEHQRNEDFKRLEPEDIPKANSLSEPLLEDIGTGEPGCENLSSHTLEASTSPFSLSSYGLEGNQVSGNFMNPNRNFECLAENVTAGCNNWNGQNGIAFVNMDSSYKPDSGAEEDPAEDEFSLGTEEVVVFQEARNETYSEFEKGEECYTDLESQLSSLNHSVTRECCEEAGPMPLMRHFCRDSDLTCTNSRTSESSDEDPAMLKSNSSDAVHEVWQIKSIENVEIQTPRAIANGLNVSDDQGNSLEPVVRSKTRKQSTSNQSEVERLLLDEEGESSSWRKTETDEVQQECALNSKEISSSMFFGSRGHEGHQKNKELRKNAAQEQKNILEYVKPIPKSAECCRYLSMCHKDEVSSECSDGERSAAATTYFTATEKDRSSDDCCETIPGREKFECEVQSRCSNGVEENKDCSSQGDVEENKEEKKDCSSQGDVEEENKEEKKDCSSQGGVEEEKKDYSSQGGQQILLEEGDIALFQSQQGGNISFVQINSIHDVVFSGFFLLEEDDNFDYDSSDSENLDTEWRIHRGPGGCLALAQSASDMSPIAHQSLEEHLQEAMETALAHLGLLGFEIDEAHPPATKETIDSLPQIVVTNDQNGQEQRCIICCCDYVENEIITELPCHHLFHRTCVTLWLQESGTCPVCRHVLARVPPETDAATVSIPPDHDLASSPHSDTGTTD